ncbi:hypothetical protein A2U01_0004216, partial [Trifolium medium]|nr:hypothetical protein [Trifolium medium]
MATETVELASDHHTSTIHE